FLFIQPAPFPLHHSPLPPHTCLLGLLWFLSINKMHAKTHVNLLVPKIRPSLVNHCPHLAFRHSSPPRHQSQSVRLHCSIGIAEAPPTALFILFIFGPSTYWQDFLFVG